ncbi:hypothetical protein (nucleomorph) [Guillardia theta]|uniref:Uncharacterized protein n=1 Tax=Guillardia theta TaxID=55529 RepID=Q98RP8_GUITH|nr:hypothetical protein GTHECHR1105 [Guillardia theta]AAK39898.1 hypothetical protein [Guillardia theta]
MNNYTFTKFKIPIYFLKLIKTKSIHLLHKVYYNPKKFNFHSKFNSEKKISFIFKRKFTEFFLTFRLNSKYELISYVNTKNFINFNKIKVKNFIERIDLMIKENFLKRHLLHDFRLIFKKKYT